MEEILKEIVSITDVLLSPTCDLKDKALFSQLGKLEELLKKIDASGLWDEIGFSFDEQYKTEGVAHKGAAGRKRVSIEQFYNMHKHLGVLGLRDYLLNLRDSINSYLRKSYNII